MIMRPRMAVVLLAGCAHSVPVATGPKDLCIRDASVVAINVVPRAGDSATPDRLAVCYPDDCFIMDPARGHILERVEVVEGPYAPPERFDVSRTAEQTTICDNVKHTPCKTVVLPGVEDQQTAIPAISANGHELYYVRREANQVFLDTIEIEQHTRRLARVPLAIANPDDHMFDVTRVGTAVLVRDTIATEEFSESQKLLIDPFTGAKRVVEDAEQLDEETALVFERRRATIVDTRGLVTLAAYDLPANQFPPRSGVVGSLAAFAHGSPPTLVNVSKRSFANVWRLPVCH